ncbi:MAG: HPr(Ser) kinase/phosphatase [Lachnospiraceae bacterium]|nr:HPr(Ser) kinase/phosphatase [Lachnospiraceae bacterium]
MSGVSVTDLIERLSLTNHTPDIDTDKIMIETADINRTALQLTGFFEHFEKGRVQVIGFVEYTYMQRQSDEEKLHDIVDKLMSYKFPCIIFCRDLEPLSEFYDAAEKYGVPLLTTKRATSEFSAEIIRWLNVELAPMISIHGVLVDVYGEGVLITGESGIGKSEAALELIKRGHRLVSDDVVEIRRVSEVTLIGTSPDITRHFIELRGIGIIDVKTLFGVEHVKETQSIDLVIKLEDWSREAEYDRLGLEEEYEEILGNKVVCHSIPIRPGRNLAVIVESAAVNHRQKKMGYNAAQELYNRVTGNLRAKEQEMAKNELEEETRAEYLEDIK